MKSYSSSNGSRSLNFSMNSTVSHTKNTPALPTIATISRVENYENWFPPTDFQNKAMLVPELNFMPLQSVPDCSSRDWDGRPQLGHRVAWDFAHIQAPHLSPRPNLQRRSCDNMDLVQLSWWRQGLILQFFLFMLKYVYLSYTFCLNSCAPKWASLAPTHHMRNHFHITWLDKY